MTPWIITELNFSGCNHASITVLFLVMFHMILILYDFENKSI